jgi:hypothetical protein
LSSGLIVPQQACEAKLPAGGLASWISTEAQDSFTLSRNGFQESASLLASSKCPSSKSLPTHLKYSQRNDAYGNWYTCSFGAHKSNFLAEINTDRIAGLRSRTLSGHPDDMVRILMLSERLRNLVPRLRSSKAFFSPDFRFNHSTETPITIPVKKDQRKFKPTLLAQCDTSFEAHAAPPDVGFWCARRAVAFALISIICGDG